MKSEELGAKNPLRALGLKGGEEPVMGLVMARAGLGKTAILVQFALDCMLLGNKVLHVSIGESVDKTRSWYDDILGRLTGGEKLDDIPGIMKNRMIMTFKENVFSSARFEERLEDFISQDVYRPDCLIIDGYEFTENSRSELEELGKFMAEKNIGSAWFSAVSHRGDQRKSAAGVPAPCHEIDDMFANVLLIMPDADAITLDIIKCDSGSHQAGAKLWLDPATMLVQKS
ncbi:MAG: hypothetical protein CSB24_06535 [Deltaproteobacteria bacterium]|nr:MAG: hypothetical protein CSB24_06535 [Deltaproteobacteria bacterium]